MNLRGRAFETKILICFNGYNDDYILKISSCANSLFSIMILMAESDLVTCIFNVFCKLWGEFFFY